MGPRTGIPKRTLTASVLPRASRFENMPGGTDTCCGSTQPCIPPGSLNLIPASAGKRAGMSSLPGGR